MKTSVCKIFSFESAHYLPGYKGKCSNLHGHHWTLEVGVSGPVNKDSGMVIDFAELKSIVNQVVIDRLDHTCLNDLELPFSKTPTCENLLEWIATRLNWDRGPEVVCRLRLYETPDSFAEVSR